MKPLSTSIYTFEKLRDEGFLYVDKTEKLLPFIQTTGQYFLSRPRRFGKSLLVSTLRAIFEGRRELFEGLAIADADWGWDTHPVIQLDMGAKSSPDGPSLAQSLLYQLDDIASSYALKLSREQLADRFVELIQSLSEGNRKVVILVDEYDKPLLNHLGTEQAAEIQQVLKSFYAVIKTTEYAQRFVLLTGVSKFSQVSVFSDLNNLTDLTMDRRASTLLGYTQEELEENFPDYISALAEEQGTDAAGILPKIRKWYNGYGFHPDEARVYNPVSVMKCFQNREFKNYWFETGTPSFLIRLAKQHPVPIGDLEVSELAFSAYDPANLEILPLLVQTGYLTIQKATGEGLNRRYLLSYPNQEIEQAFSYWLAREFGGINGLEMEQTLDDLRAALAEDDLEELFAVLRSFFAGIPYELTQNREAWYQTVLFTVFKLMGAEVQAEVRTNRGRIDAVVKTRERIYIFEFKLQGSAEQALEQIRDKGYAEPYRNDARELSCIGVAFDESTRNLGAWLVEKL